MANLSLEKVYQPAEGSVFAAISIRGLAMTQLAAACRAARVSVLRLILTCALIFLSSALFSVGAQKSAIAPANVAAGAPAGSYSLSGFESVNLYSGNLNFNLPLVQTGGRGGARIPFSLVVNNASRWGLSRPSAVTNFQASVAYSIDVYDSGQTVKVLYDGINTSWGPVYFKATEVTFPGNHIHFDGGLRTPPREPEPADRPYHIEAPFLHPTDMPYVLQHPKIGYNPGLLLYRTAYQGGRLDTDPNKTVLGRSLTRISFTTSDGTQYELRDIKTGGAANDARINGNQVYSRGRVFVTADGSSASFISDVEVTEQFNFHLDNVRPDRPSGYLLFADGNRYRIDSGNVSWIRDRNGNLTTFAYDGNNRVVSARDNVGHTITIAYRGMKNPATGAIYDHDEIGFTGTGGNPRSIKVWRGRLSDALDGGTVKTIGELFPAWELDDTGDEVVNPDDVASAVELPDGRRYELRYNTYGEMSRVILPTGGKIEYDYLLIASPFILQRRIKERRVYRNASDATPELKQGFTYSITDGLAINRDIQTVEVEQRAGADDRLLSFQKHFFHGEVSTFHMGLYTSWREGKEFKTETFNTDGARPTSLLRRVEHNWHPRQYTSYYPGNPDRGPGFDPRIVETVTTLETGQVAKQTAIDPQNLTVGFDRFNNQTNLWESDFGAGAPGAWLRHTRTSYVPDATYTGGSNDIGSEPNPDDILATPHLRRLPSQKSVFDATNGLERARSIFEYDNYTAEGEAGKHAALQPRDRITGLCLTLDAKGNCFRPSDANYTKRGNVTATTGYLLDGGGGVTGSVSSYLEYDVAGNVVRAIDGRGARTDFSFDDNFGSPDNEARSNSAPPVLDTSLTYAFPTIVTNALGQSVYTQYDYYTGQIVNTEDMNGVVGSISYLDPLDRPTRADHAVNVQGLHSQIAFSYDDTNHIITTTSDQERLGDGLLKSQVLYDGLGRTTETRNYEGGGNYIALQTQYDALDRAFMVSNPFRPWRGEGAIWTTTTFDALGRVISITTPDSAVSTTDYDGNSVTVTDQMRKQRKSVTDALGRLTKVYEAPDDPGYNYLTSYQYDALSNLTSVTQDNQTRVFMYDSLGRLIRTRIPEQDVNGSLNLFDPVTRNSQWTGSYDYDENGNLRHRTDARNITTTYDYDALNRPVSKSYQNDPTGTNRVSYFYDRQGLPLGAPPLARDNSAGRLVAVTYGGGSAGDYYAYDAGGRSVLKIQQTGGMNYTVGATYNLAGAITSETYPSKHVVSYNYDAAGRLSSFGGTLGDGTPRTYSAGISYSPLGGMSQERFGTQTPIYNKLFYNVRGQLSEIRDGTQPNDTSWNRGVIINHYSNLCWGMCLNDDGTTKSMPDNDGNLKLQEHWIPLDDPPQPTKFDIMTQRYDYDKVNRLQRVYYEGNPANPSQPAWQQYYNYDRFGNRTINEAQSYGTGTPEPQFELEPGGSLTNRLYAPGDMAIADPEARQMRYDKAGNLKYDSFTGQGDRKYDAENRMTSETNTSNVVVGSYGYDGDGRRVVRNVGGVVTWQVYGLGGGLLAEYPEKGSPDKPQKEYGYRNGQLLITATTTTASVADKGATASGAANAAAPSFSGPNPLSKGDQIKVEHLTELRAAVNNLRQQAGLSAFNFTVDPDPQRYVTTVKADHVLQLRTALEEVLSRFALPTGAYEHTNLHAGDLVYAKDFQELRDQVTYAWNNSSEKLPLIGATSSRDHSPPYDARHAINGNLSDLWSAGEFPPQWIQVDLGQTKTISRVRLLVDQYPDGHTTHQVYGGPSPDNLSLLGRFDGGTVFHQWLELNVSASDIRYIKVSTTASPSWVGWAEIEVYGSSGRSVPPLDASPRVQLNWLVADQLGTPRMVFDQSGGFASVSRHDYLPFGEELFTGTGGRTTDLGYSKVDYVRQRFTGQERDEESGLDFFGARYYSSKQGRFTGVDPLAASAKLANPQTWNRYMYVINNPMRFTDPTGMIPEQNNWQRGEGAPQPKTADEIQTQSELPPAVIAIPVAAEIATPAIAETAFATAMAGAAALAPVVSEAIKDVTLVLWGGTPPASGTLGPREFTLEGRTTPWPFQPGYEPYSGFYVEMNRFFLNLWIDRGGGVREADPAALFRPDSHATAERGVLEARGLRQRGDNDREGAVGRRRHSSRTSQSARGRSAGAGSPRWNGNTNFMENKFFDVYRYRLSPGGFGGGGAFSGGGAGGVGW